MFTNTFQDVYKYLIWKWCRMCAKYATVYPVRWNAWCTISKNNHQHIFISKALPNKLITFTQKQVRRFSFINLFKLHFAALVKVSLYFQHRLDGLLFVNLIDCLHFQVAVSYNGQESEKVSWCIQTLFEYSASLEVDNHK